MHRRTTISKAAAIAVGGAVIGALVAQDVRAQTTLEAVTVTGTRIRSPGVVSNSPITSVTAEEVKTAQPVVVEEFVKTLPAAVPGIGAGTNNGSGGGATIDMRGLGANRSLVLLDGRRMTPFDLTGAVDTNSVPMALLSRIDVVTGGASAVYGADAVAGVTNFVLRKDFRGIDLSTSYGISGENDAKRTRTDLTMGAGLDGGKGNVALSFGFTKTDPVRQDARELGLVSRSSVTGNASGSGTTVPVNLIGYGQIDLATGQFGVNPTQSFNFNPDNYYQTPLQRKQITALGNYSINQNVEVYSLVTFTRSDVFTQLAPSGTFFNDFFLPLGNPYLPAAARAQLCAGEGLTAAQCADNNFEVLISPGRRLVEFGPRLNNFENSAYQLTAGVRGELIGSWTYDAYASQGQADQTQTRGNWGSNAKIQQALRATNTTTCTDPANGCVPLNLFGGAGSITPAMVSFIDLDAVLTQKVKQKVFSASVSGDLGNIKSPMARQPIAVAVGAEYRHVTAGNKSDGPSQIQGEVLGTGAPLPDRSGSLSLKEGFGELIVPVVSDMPMAQKINLELGARYSQFSSATKKDYNTYKMGGEWEPVRGFRVRGMGQRATRAPNIDELYEPLTSGLDNLAVDPCEGANTNQAQANTAGTLSNLCRLTGVPVASLGALPPPSAGQINVQQGGNPNLSPETADTTTLGIVFQPDFAKGLTVTADYYKIKVDGMVSNPAVDDVISACYSAAANPTFAFNASCAQVQRNPNNGTFNGAAAPGVLLPRSNLGKMEVAGYDLGVSYNAALSEFGLAPSLGRIDASLNVSILDTYNYQATPSAVNRNCVGYYSIACGTVSAGEGPLNKTKFNQRTTWMFGDYVVGYNWRHLSKVVEEPGGQAFLPAYSTIKAYNYFDLSGTWNVNKNIRLNVSINNLFDKKPPAVGNTIGTTSANSGNTFPQTYDVIGRYFVLGASVKF